jgi:hypothetical protein
LLCGSEGPDFINLYAARPYVPDLLIVEGRASRPCVYQELGNGVYARLLGSKENEDTPELLARSEEFKWQPFRRDCRNFTKHGGIGFSGSSFRIYARLFARNIEQFGYTSNSELPDIETIFLVTFSDGSGTTRLYNTMASSLGNFVESAVIDQDVIIEH